MVGADDSVAVRRGERIQVVAVVETKCNEETGSGTDATILSDV